MSTTKIHEKINILQKEYGENVLITGNRCYQCSHEWKSNIKKSPVKCPKCLSLAWKGPRKSIGRPITREETPGIILSRKRNKYKQLLNRNKISEREYEKQYNIAKIEYHKSKMEELNK